MKKLQINGTPHEVAAENIAELLVELHLTGQAVAVERNGQVVRKRDHAATPVAAGDRIELVTLVGGG